MIKLIVTDLDGTFLNSHGEFDHAYYQQVKALMDQEEVTFAACTGKQCERVEELFEPTGDDNLWIIGDSATRIKYKGEFKYQSLLSNEIGQKIITKLLDVATDHVVIGCIEDGAVILDTTPQELADLVRRSYTKMIKTADFKEIKDDFVKITVFDPHKRCFETVKELTPFEEDAYIVASEAAWIDITNKGVHKGTTIAHLQELLGVTPEDTMAFGDGLNDVELMQSAFYSFAMRHAFDETKAAARFIAGSNDENSVLETIESLLKLQANE